MSKKQTWNIGDIVVIPTSKNRHAYGHILESPLIAFYGIESGCINALGEIKSFEVIFKIWVMKYAITDCEWKIIGNIAPNPDVLTKPFFFKQDPINGKCVLYSDEKEKPIECEKCNELERAAIWEPEHVVDRLRDHFAGRQNKWVISMKPKIIP